MNGRVLSIQWLRAVAALSVVAYHEIGAVAGYYPGWRPYHLIAGNIGVDIFFCISGFSWWWQHARTATSSIRAISSCAA